MKPGNGRAPFNKSWFWQDRGITYFYSDTLPYSLIEITGVGCEVLTRNESILKLIKDWSHRLTRIDIAVDFVTDIDPLTFARERNLNKFPSGAEMKSEQGVTCYVGSRKSDRYARVYKYNPPHPRSNTLRCEMVCKDEKAKMAGLSIVRDGLLSVTRSLGEVFVWQHPLWDFDEDVQLSDLKSVSETHQGNTERWLLTSVMAAIEKLQKRGADDFIVYFLDQVYDRTGLTAERAGNGEKTVLPNIGSDTT